MVVVGDDFNCQMARMTIQNSRTQNRENATSTQLLFLPPPRGASPRRLYQTGPPGVPPSSTTLASSPWAGVMHLQGPARLAHG